MNSIIPLEFEGQQLRFVGTPDKPEWIAQDVADILEIASVRSTLRNFKPYQRGVHTMHVRSGDGTIQEREMLTVTEAGLYALVLKSRKEQAERFREWLFDEVLPEIRRTGSYTLNKNVPPPAVQQQYELDCQRVQERSYTKVYQKDVNDCIRQYLEAIRQYSDKVNGTREFIIFSDTLNRKIIGESAQQFRKRTGYEVKLIRDYFPQDVLNIYATALNCAQLEILRGTRPYTALNIVFQQVGALKRWHPRLLVGQELESIIRPYKRIKEYESTYKVLQAAS